jgi:hypothetical protein
MERTETNIVKTSDQRPAVGFVGVCAYCQSPVGAEHGPECVCRLRTVVYRVVMEVVSMEPAYWDKHLLDFHKNESSWCADNFTSDLKDPIEGCACHAVKFEFVREATREDEVSLPRMRWQEEDGGE